MCGASRSDSVWWNEVQKLTAQAAEREAAERAELEAVKADGVADVDRILAEIEDRHPAFAR